MITFLVFCLGAIFGAIAVIGIWLQTIRVDDGYAVHVRRRLMEVSHG